MNCLLASMLIPWVTYCQKFWLAKSREWFLTCIQKKQQYPADILTETTCSCTAHYSYQKWECRKNGQKSSKLYTSFRVKIKENFTTDDLVDDGNNSVEEFYMVVDENVNGSDKVKKLYVKLIKLCYFNWKRLKRYGGNKKVNILSILVTINLTTWVYYLYQLSDMMSEVIWSSQCRYIRFRMYMATNILSFYTIHQVSKNISDNKLSLLKIFQISQNYVLKKSKFLKLIKMVYVVGIVWMWLEIS